MCQKKKKSKKNKARNEKKKKKILSIWLYIQMDGTLAEVGFCKWLFTSVPSQRNDKCTVYI
jgi:hypothetical protein